jgi:hypothetical protein
MSSLLRLLNALPDTDRAKLIVALNTPSLQKGGT